MAVIVSDYGPLLLIATQAKRIKWLTPERNLVDPRWVESSWPRPFFACDAPDGPSPLDEDYGVTQGEGANT